MIKIQILHFKLTFIHLEKVNAKFHLTMIDVERCEL